MSKVNPPPHLRTPEKIFDDPELREYFKELEFIIFQLWKRTGGQGGLPDYIELSAVASYADTIVINQRIGSGNALTSDETGFTVDLTTLSVDMTEAQI